jgi:hypothetical protein
MSQFSDSCCFSYPFTHYHNHIRFFGCINISVPAWGFSKRSPKFLHEEYYQVRLH